MTISLHGADFELTWPRQLFVDEARSVLASGHKDANSRYEWLLEDAFAGSAPLDLFQAKDSEPTFIRLLISQAGQLRETSARAPYWLERRAGTAPGDITLAATPCGSSSR